MKRETVNKLSAALITIAVICAYKLMAQSTSCVLQVEGFGTWTNAGIYFPQTGGTEPINDGHWHFCHDGDYLYLRADDCPLNGTSGRGTPFVKLQLRSIAYGATNSQLATMVSWYLPVDCNSAVLIIHESNDTCPTETISLEAIQTNCPCTNGITQYTNAPCP